ncbi:integrase arm-type DNA-binding domain-containing protein [Massilia sp. TS11]|uniref:tyrosine-type recombinase/integrase n=1 Tax=Massilia sp. TS11 TaxID=2908003 RepID=UPI001EDC52DC|nr:integrase arm-type DNA-binding domain-containing protein [Massilia sp. TS11]MCG2586551.1 integrase arm-type DNA-binding domain-containing protein [Massilia sp. TS11]
MVSADGIGDQSAKKYHQIQGFYMALSDTFCRQVKHSGSPAGDKHVDGDSLYLLVKAAGKYWRMNYRFYGKQKTLALGVYPEVSLVMARRARDHAKQMLATGVDPSEVKRQGKREAARAKNTTFETVASDWLKTTGKGRAELTQKRVESWFKRDVFPFIGSRPISEIRPREISVILEKMQSRGVRETTHRVLGYLHGVFELAMAWELVERDPTTGIKQTLEKYQAQHHEAITDPEKLAPLLRAMWGYEGHPACRTALKLAPYLFVRPGELRRMEWSEISFEDASWIIPAEKMKMRQTHVVPLATQVLDIIRTQQNITGHGRYVMPSIKSTERPMSENTVNFALRELGFGDQVVGHGFRATARTIMDEVLGERVDLIEHQLSHTVKDANGRAYNRTSHLPARREMMQRWADYLDKLRGGAEVVHIRRA